MPLPPEYVLALLDATHDGMGEDGTLTPRAHAERAGILAQAREAAGEPVREALDVPSAWQSTRWNCGPAAMQAVLTHHGIEADEHELAAALDTHPENGTCPGAMVDHVRGLGLPCSEGQGLSIEDLAEATGNGAPVLCCIQKGENGGHWVVVQGVGTGGVEIMDPASGEEEVISPEEWLERWKDWDADGNVYERFGLAVGGLPVREHLLENFTGVDGHGHHWVNGHQVAIGREHHARVHAELTHKTPLTVKQLAGATGLSENEVADALSHLVDSGHAADVMVRGKVAYRLGQPGHSQPLAPAKSPTAPAKQPLPTRSAASSRQSAPARQEATKKLPATVPVAKHVAANMASEMLASPEFARDGMVPIHALRKRIAEKHGPEMASHAVLDKALKELRFNQNLGLIAVSDYSLLSHQEIDDSVPGLNETFFAIKSPRDDNFNRLPIKVPPLPA